MPQDNNIQQKLQQLENQQLPDLSQMDKHWESMQALLQPAVITSKPIISLSKFFYTSVGIATLVAAILFFQKNNHSNRGLVVNSGPIAGNDIIASAKDHHGDSANNSSVSQFNVNSLHLKPQLTFTPILNDIYLSTGDTLAAEDIFKDSIFMEDENIQRQLLLTDLFKSLSKPAQHFSIDNRTDTLLLCKEGTAVMVPAHSFAGEDSVDFEIAEFYDYSDIVLNRLTTMSDTNQLISGGMLRIQAYRNDSLIELKLNKQLKVFIPGISEKDSMEIFEGREAPEVSNAPGPDWKLTNIKIQPGPKMTIWAINLVDNNFAERNFKKRTKAIFRQDWGSLLSRQVLAVRMKERYPQYSKIVVKRPEGTGWLYSWYFQRYFDRIGSREGFTPEEIERHKLDPIDTTYTFTGNTFNSIRQNSKGAAAQFNWSPVKDKYSIDINKLGWINCDRFYKTPGRKTDFYVNISDKADNYFTVIVFDKFKSVMPGSASGRNVLFPRVPVGAAVKIISIGVNAEGKPVMAMKKANIRKAGEIDLDYEVQDKESIKNSLSILNK